MSDKRSVATDALETLGTIIDDKQKRDAIHLAVLPAVAGQELKPGDHVALGDDGKAYKRPTFDPIGIVDPFLRDDVAAGERFWLVIYPRKITSLRHVWSHPGIPDTEEKPVSAARREDSEKWLRQFIDNADCPDYEEVMAEVLGGGSMRFYGNGSGEIPDEFWHHAAIVIGRPIPQEKRAGYFSCTC